MKKLYKRLSLALTVALAFATSAVLAQGRTVTGTVTDESNAPLPGVSVLIKGTTTGTATDVSGNFSLNVPGNDAVLEISFVGYATQEITVGDRSTINVTLSPDVQQLSELVVTGYSIDKRRETTGSVATVKSEDLTVVPTTNVEQQLQGRVAGVTVIQGSQPGSSSQVRVRGFGGFGDNAPLYIVDGVPTGDVGFLNPDDIETTTVLKDAAAASIYGARAANGVIVYTTKKGSRTGKKLNITYDFLYGSTNPGKGQDMMNPQDYATWTWNSIKNTAMQNDTIPVFNHPQFGTGSSPVIPEYLLAGTKGGASVTPTDVQDAIANYNVTDFSKPIIQIFKPNLAGTDWYGAITHNAPLLRQTIGISGGSDNSRYYLGLSQQDEDGILIHQHFKRYAFRANSEFDVNKYVRIGENLQFTYNQVRLLQGDNGGLGIADDESVVLSAFRMPSIIPVYDMFGGYAGTRAPGFNNPNNPVAALDRQKDDRGFQNAGFGNVYLEVEPIPGLVARTSIAGNFGGDYYWSYGAHSYENSENNASTSFSQGDDQFFGWTYTNTLDYKKTFGVHDLDVLVGQEALDEGSGRGMSGTGLNPFSQDRNFVTLSTTQAGSTRTVGSYFNRGKRFASYFGRLNYTYNDRYMASVVIRRDGSSAFGPANRYGVFPAFSAGWRISSEGFMSGMTWIDDLKIRGGYGEMGNTATVSGANQYSLYATNIDASSYPIDNGGATTGFYRSRIGNPLGKWETAITKNIGFDGTFFNGKLDVIFDVWQKDSKDLLLQVPLTVENGPFAALPSQNVGKMVNKGIDLEVTTKGNKGEIGYEVTATGGVLHNEITELIGDQTYITYINPSYRGINPIRNQIGHSISSFYGYQVVGLFNSQAEIDAAATQDGVIKSDPGNGVVGQGVGRFHYADLDGDGVITDKDRTYLGSPVPKFTGGLTLKLTYHGFEFETYLYAVVGDKIWNQSKWFTDFYPSFAGAAISTRVKDSWTPTHTNTDIPIFENFSNFSTNAAASSFYVENGSYLRAQNISVSYTLPAAMAQKVSMSKVKISAGVNNVFTITGYDGLDPSVGGNADTNFGVDVGNYPLTRQWTLGLNLGF